MPPKISKKRTYSKRSIIQENQNKKLGKNSDSEKRFKKGEELKNYQTRSYLKRDIQSNMKLSDELIKGFGKFNNIFLFFKRKSRKFNTKQYE